MNSGTPGSITLVAAITAATYSEQLHILAHFDIDAIYSMVVVIAWLWGLSYLGTMVVMKSLRLVRRETA